MQQFYKYFLTYFAMLITLNAKNIIKERNRVIQIHSVHRLDHAVLKTNLLVQSNKLRPARKGQKNRSGQREKQAFQTNLG